MNQSSESYFKDHRESMEVGHLALRGAIISVVRQYGVGALQIIAAVILARLLTPSDFGLVTMVAVLTTFAPMLIDFGLGDATAQKSKITPAQVSALFWLSTGIGFAIAGVMAASSPFIAALYHEPRLEPIALSTSTIFVMWGLSSQHLALLRRTMQFGAIARLQFSGTLIGIIVAVVLALCGFGYWALVIRPLANALFVTCGSWLACSWRPGYPVFDRDVKSMIRFGMHIVIWSVTYSMSRAVDRIGLGLFYKPDQVGFYQNSMNLYDYSITATLGQVHTVGSAALSKLQANPAALRQKFEVALSTLAFFAMPMAVILSVTGEDLTVILLGEKWQASGYLLSIIALRGVFQVIDSAQGWLHLALGKPDRWKNWGIISLGVWIIATLAGLPFGTVGLASTGVLANIILAVPSIVYAGRPIGIGIAVVIRAAGPQLAGSIIAATLGWWLQTATLSDCSRLTRIFLSATCCICIYLLVVVGLFRITQPFRIMGKFMRDLMRPS